MSKIFIVATPIGNLEDITFRAIETLKEVDIILCEDTRMTKKILNKYNIEKPTLSYHVKSRFSKINKIIELLKEGKNLALVSDAGTPGISDPGSVLVNKIRKELPNVSIVPVPGASALTAALSASGAPFSSFLFLGFLPHKKGREKLFKEIEKSKRTVVFYESPHRIIKTLEALKKHLGYGQKIIIARELTKIYEEFIYGTPEEVLKIILSAKEKQKGEFVVIVESAGKAS